METIADIRLIEGDSKHEQSTGDQTLSLSARDAVISPDTLIDTPLGLVLYRHNTVELHRKNLETRYKEIGGVYTVSTPWIKTLQGPEGEKQFFCMPYSSTIPESVIYAKPLDLPDSDYGATEKERVRQDIQLIKNQEALANSRSGPLTIVSISPTAMDGSMGVEMANEDTKRYTMIFIISRSLVNPDEFEATQIFVTGEKHETPVEMHQQALTLAALLDPAQFKEDEPQPTATELISRTFVLNDIADDVLRNAMLNQDGSLNLNGTIETVLRTMGKSPSRSIEQQNRDADELIQVLFESGAADEYIAAVTGMQGREAMERGLRHSDNFYKYLVALYTEQKLSIGEIRSIAMQVKGVIDDRTTVSTIKVNEKNNTGSWYSFESSPFELARRANVEVQTSVKQTTRVSETAVVVDRQPAPHIPVIVPLPSYSGFTLSAFLPLPKETHQPQVKADAALSNTQPKSQTEQGEQRSAVKIPSRSAVTQARTAPIVIKIEKALDTRTSALPSAKRPEKSPTPSASPLRPYNPAPQTPVPGPRPLSIAIPYVSQKENTGSQKHADSAQQTSHTSGTASVKRTTGTGTTTKTTTVSHTSTSGSVRAINRTHAVSGSRQITTKRTEQQHPNSISTPHTTITEPAITKVREKSEKTQLVRQSRSSNTSSHTGTAVTRQSTAKITAAQPAGSYFARIKPRTTMKKQYAAVSQAQLMLAGFTPIQRELLGTILAQNEGAMFGDTWLEGSNNLTPGMVCELRGRGLHFEQLETNRWRIFTGI